MGRIVDLNVSIGRIQWIGQRVVVEKVVVAPEGAAEVVPLVFRHAQARSVFRIAAPSEAGKKQSVEQSALVIQGADVERLVEQAQPLALVDEGVVNRLAAVGINETVTELERSLVVVDRKSTRLNSSHPSISYAVFCLKKKNSD